MTSTHFFAALNFKYKEVNDILNNLSPLSQRTYHKRTVDR